MTGSSQEKCYPACRAPRSASREIKGRLLGCIHSCLSDDITRDEQGCSLSASPVCTTSNRRSGGGRAGLTHPAGWTQPVRARLSSPLVALTHLSCPQLPPRALTWHGILVMLSALSFFFWLFPSLLQSDSGESQGNLHRTEEAWLCFRGLIWVIKFSSINAMGVPLFETTPSKLNQKIYGGIKS